MKHRRVTTTLYPDEEEIIKTVKDRGYADCDSSAIRFALWFLKENWIETKEIEQPSDRHSRHDSKNNGSTEW